MLIIVVALVLIAVSRCGFILLAITQPTLSPQVLLPWKVLLDSLHFESCVDLYGERSRRLRYPAGPQLWTSCAHSVCFYF